MAQNNIRMAMASIGTAKWRSFLTMLGVIIGVVSVVTIVSLGEGVKHQLTDQVKRTGSDLITVRGGILAERDKNGRIAKVNALSLFAGTNLGVHDYETVQSTKGLRLVVPFASITGVPETPDGHTVHNLSVVATTGGGSEALHQDVQYGGFFDDSDLHNGVAVLGKQAALALFQEEAPIGKSFVLRGQKFVVQGVFKTFAANPLNPGVDYNGAIFIPYTFGKDLVGGNLQPYQILARPNNDTAPAAAAQAITASLQKAHGGQIDFTVLQADDTVAVAGNVLNLITSLVTAVAAVSLIVGGIGIMNIMLVAVSERTHEIGVRKSVGATNRQIMRQFMAEAVVLSTTGGILGVLLSMLANYLLRILTDLQPVITLPIMGLAVLVAIIVGTIFGMTPALQAARKDPIDALRRI